MGIGIDPSVQLEYNKMLHKTIDSATQRLRLKSNTFGLCTALKPSKEKQPFNPFRSKQGELSKKMAEVHFATISTNQNKSTIED